MTTPFVARAAQTAQLLAAVDRAAAASPTVVLLGADAGVGKSRLLTHVGDLARRRGAVVVTASCVDLGEIGLPYLPFAEALAQIVALGGQDVSEVVASRPALSRLLPSGTPVPSTTAAAEPTDRLQLFEAVAAVLAAAGTADAPFVLVVEDLHWADSSSRDLLRYLVARLRAEHVLLVASYRSDDLHRRHPLRPVLAELSRHPRVERIDLPPFTTVELREFTTAVAGAPLPDDAFRQVAQRSEGNAFFAEELTESGPSGATLPWTLGDVLRARLEQLDPEVQHLARVASVAGRRVSEPLLRAVLLGPAPTPADADTMAATLREAVAHHVLVGEDGRIAFRHALLAEVVYADLLPGERVALHRDYLRALSDGAVRGNPAQIAHHAVQSHDVATALRASRDAARGAARMLAPQEQLRHLETVLGLWSAVPTAADDLGEDRVDVLAAAAAAASSAGHSDRAVALAREAVEATGSDPARQAPLRVAFARHLLSDDRPGEALTESERALAALSGPMSGAERAWALALLARAALGEDRDDESREAATAAVREARSAGEAAAEADALTTLAVLAEEPETVAGLLDEALSRAREAGDPLTELRCWYNLASSRYYAGDLPGAAATTDLGMDRARETGLTWHVWGSQLRMLVELIRYVRGDLTAAGPTTEPVPEVAAQLLDAVALYAATARGDADAADRGLALAASDPHEMLVVLIAGACAVDALTWSGQHARGVTLALEVMDRLSRAWHDDFLGGIWVASLAIAALADQAGQDRLAGADPAEHVVLGTRLRDTAVAIADQGRPIGGRLGPEGQAWLARVHAEHARLQGVDDPEAWRLATEGFGYGYTYEEARSRWRWAEALVGSGDRAAAREQAAAALDAATRIGAAPLAQAVRDLARRARLDLPGVPDAGADVLTSREAEVIALVAQGLTNRQIGERLFISGKTVSVHISNVLAKLDASGRAEAVAVAHRRGLLGSRATVEGDVAADV